MQDHVLKPIRTVMLQPVGKEFVHRLALNILVFVGLPSDRRLGLLIRMLDVLLDGSYNVQGDLEHIQELYLFYLL